MDKNTHNGQTNLEVNYFHFGSNSSGGSKAAVSHKWPVSKYTPVLFFAHLLTSAPLWSRTSSSSKFRSIFVKQSPPDILFIKHCVAWNPSANTHIHTHDGDVLLLLLSCRFCVPLRPHAARSSSHYKHTHLQLCANTSQWLSLTFLITFLTHTHAYGPAFNWPSRACPHMQSVLQQHLIQNLFSVNFSWKLDRLSYAH